MQSHQNSFGSDVAKRYGHRRSPSLGKAMPVTSLLMHFPPPSSTSSLRTSGMRDGRTPEHERPPFYFQVDDSSANATERDNVTKSLKDDDLSSADELNIEQEYELLVSECSSDNGGGGSGDPDGSEHISLIGNSIFYTPCLTCTDRAPDDLGTRATAINEMCRRLCTDECRLRLSLAGFVPPSTSTLKSREALTEYVKDALQRPQLQHTCSEDTLQSYPTQQNVNDSFTKAVEQSSASLPLPPRRPSRIAIQRKKFLTDLLVANTADTDSDSNFADEDAEKGNSISQQQPQEPLDTPLRKCVKNLVELQELNRNAPDEVASGDNRRPSVAVDLHELAMLKDFREKFEIAEALAKTSAMTSTAQMKQRLAARKLEIANANATAAGFHVAAADKDGRVTQQHRHHHQPQQQQQQQRTRRAKQTKQQQRQRRRQRKTLQQQPHELRQGAANSVAGAHDALPDSDAIKNKNKNRTYSNSGNCDDGYDHSDDELSSNENSDCNNSNSNSNSNNSEDDDHDDEDDIATFGFDADIATTRSQQQQQQDRGVHGDFEPPRDLLLYLVRMGSFNSAPKINNIDSQDDSLEIPKGLTTSELLQHVKHLRGEDRPQLLTRYFAKPSLAAQMVANDVTDGLRSLQLETLPREYSATSTLPNHIRVLQWNILSQTLGQNNDGFVRCPEEALTWEHRKFLIVQEILQNNPDIICLQEVDHFKFLQTILGTQNYEGIFFPKPDSPCLYIEENNGPDGCAMFYRRDKFELKHFDTRILEVWRVQSNQVAIVANFSLKASGKEVCVCTTHLKARQGALLSKLRNEQGRDLLRFVKQFAGDRPVIICGDFNAEPTEPVYATILNCDILKLASAYSDIKVERDECNNDSDQGDGNTNANGDTTEDAEVSADKVQQSIAHEPAYTTWKIREDGEECHTIDYVFYSQEHLQIRNCLEFPRGDEIGKNRTPCFQYPSDHFSLVCDFELMNKQ